MQNGTVILHANANTDIKVNDKSVKDVVVYNPDSFVSQFAVIEV